MAGLVAGLWLAAGAAWADPPVIVALGDSLTQGYGLPPGQGFVPQLQAWLQDHGTPATVLNAGVSGDTTAGALARTDWALVPQAGALIVTLGGNDILRGLPPEDARANLDAILSKADARKIPVLLVAMAAPGNYGAEYQSAFDAIYPELAAAHGALAAGEFLGPIRAAIAAGTPVPDLVQPDGLHPTARGVALVVEALGPEVQKLLARAAAPPG